MQCLHCPAASRARSCCFNPGPRSLSDALIESTSRVGPSYPLVSFFSQGFPFEANQQKVLCPFLSIEIHLRSSFGQTMSTLVPFLVSFLGRGSSPAAGAGGLGCAAAPVHALQRPGLLEDGAAGESRAAVARQALPAGVPRMNGGPCISLLCGFKPHLFGP